MQNLAIKMYKGAPKVTVCMVTYNHEKYIQQCLRSIVEQKTDFNFEVIVSDDCSTDGTREIIRIFANEYPDLIKPIYQKRNIGAFENFLFTQEQGTGEYIASIDGDDYWLPGKLQAQADILDKDPGCNIVFHRMLLDIGGGIYEGSLQIPRIEDLVLSRGDLIQYMSLAGHSSKMHRRSKKDYKKPNFEVIDYFANVEQVGDGYARFSGSDYYGVYRMGIGISSSSDLTRILLAKSIGYFSKKYPEYKKQANTAALLCMLVDIKNFRKTSLIYTVIWIKTFHYASIINLYKNMRFIKKTTLTKLLKYSFDK